MHGDERAGRKGDLLHGKGLMSHKFRVGLSGKVYKTTQETEKAICKTVGPAECQKEVVHLGNVRKDTIQRNPRD